MADATHFAVRATGDDGVEKLYVTKVVSVFPTGASVSAGTSAEIRATVAALEALLDGVTSVAVPPGTIGSEGQLIQG